MQKGPWAFYVALGSLGFATACGGSSPSTSSNMDGGVDGIAEGGGNEGGGDAAPYAEAGDANLAEGGEGGYEAGLDGTSAEGGEAGNADASEGGACGWVPFNDGLSGASIDYVAFDARATPALAYATSGSDFYVSSDGGHTWTMKGSYAGGIGLLATPGTDPSVIYAASPGGVIKSTDGGDTWSLLSLGGQATSSIAAAPDEALRMYVGVRGSGVLESNDGGMTWTAVNNGYPYVDTIDLDVAPDNADDLVAGGPELNMQGGYSSSGDLLRSTNAGQTWTTVLSGDGVVWDVRRCTTDPTVLYAATDDGMARSGDRGATWTLQAALPGQVEDVAITPGACNDVYAMVSGYGPYHTTDGGQTFGSALTQGLDLISPSGRMAVSPSTTTDLILGSHGGVFYSTDATTWNIAQGLLGLVVDTLSVSPLDPAHLWLSSWGSGVWQRSSPTQAWQRISTQALPVDYAFAVAADPYTANRVLVGGQYPYLSTDDGSTFSAGTLGENEMSFAFDSTDSSVLYLSTELNGVYKSTDGAMTWTAMNSGLTPWSQQLGTPVIDVWSLVVDPAAPQTLYIATDGAGIYKSTDGAQSWNNVLGPTQVIPCLLAVGGTSTTLYACVQGAGLEMSTDGGGHWSAFNEGLPTLDINGLTVDGTTGDLYATSSDGVFVKRGSQPWASFDTLCLSGTAAVTPAILVNGTSRMLVVGAGGGVYAHPL